MTWSSGSYPVRKRKINCAVSPQLLSTDFTVFFFFASIGGSLRLTTHFWLFCLFECPFSGLYLFSLWFLTGSQIIGPVVHRKLPF